MRFGDRDCGVTYAVQIKDQTEDPSHRKHSPQEEGVAVHQLSPVLNSGKNITYKTLR